MGLYYIHMLRKNLSFKILIVIGCIIPIGLAFGNATTTDTSTLLEETIADSQSQAVSLDESRSILFEATRGQSATLNEQQRQRITNLAANTSNRLEATISRLQNIIDRTERRIFLTENTGTTVTSATEALAAAQTSLDTAELLIKDIDEDVFRFLHSQDPVQHWEIVRNIYVGAEQNIKNTIIALNIAINEINFSIETTNNNDNN